MLRIISEKERTGSFSNGMAESAFIFIFIQILTMNYRYFIFIMLLAATFSFAATNCSPYFVDNFSVVVYDAQTRPIQDAAVTVHYQLDQTSGKGYIWTIPVYTNKNGLTGNIIIHNIEPLFSKLDCVFEVYATYSGKEVHKDFTVGIHSDVLDLELDAYLVSVKLMDQLSRPIEGAEVWFNSVNRTTDKTGLAYAHAIKGDLQILVQYADGKYAENIKVTSDVNKVIGVQLYELVLSAIDDNGNPLQFNATIGTTTYGSNENGSIIVEKLGTAKPEVTVKYKNVEKPIYVDLSLQKKHTIIFDATPPEFGKINVILSGTVTKLIIPAYDPGQHASGIDSEGVVAKYKIGDSGTWESTSVYLSSKDQYVAEIPNPKTESVVKFSIELKDKDGNIRTTDGQYMYVPEQQIINQPDQDTSATTTATTPAKEDFSFVFLIAGFIIVIVVIYVAYRRFFGSKE